MTVLERLSRTAQRVLRMEAAERREQESRLPLSAHMLAALGWDKPIRVEPERPIRGSDFLTQHEAEIRDVWEQAIAKLPSSMRAMITQAQQALATTEQELQQAHTALERLSAPTDNAGRHTWMIERAALQQNIAQLTALRTEQASDYVRLCMNAQERLDALLRVQGQEAAQAVQDAEDYYQEVLQRAKTERGRVQSTQRAIGTVRSEACEARLVERHLGRQVTPDPTPVDRAAEREARQIIAAHFQRGKVSV